MITEKFNLWENTPGKCDEIPTLTAYIPENKTSDGAVVILPGGGYHIRAPHEGEGYAKFLSDNGITAFVCDYRVHPHHFPIPLLDSRRAVRTVRYYAEKYGIDKNKIAIMGSSAGGHLAAFTSTYFEPIEFEGIDDIDKEEFIPNAQILCYPVIKLSPTNPDAHNGSCFGLLGENVTDEISAKYDPELNASEKSPKCFMWHTFEDGAVPVVNSLDYAKALKKNNVPTELHIFPDGNHGLGLADTDKEDKVKVHVSQWSKLLINWLKYNKF